MGKHEKIVPTEPPAPRAPAVLEQRPTLERELADLKSQIAETALAAYERSDGRENLAALAMKIRACEFQIECKASAHDLAIRLDRESVAAWMATVQADPKKAVEGITKDSCCRRCSADHGCVISGGGACTHPIKVGHINPGLQANAGVRDVYKAAAQKLGVYR
jgi:hypothetical protein